MLAKKFEAIEQYVSNRTFPILVSYSDSQFELVGSCVSVVSNNKNYLCTASHVLESAQAAKTTIVVGLNRKFVELKLEKVEYSTNEDVNFDLCIIPIEIPEEGLEFIVDKAFHMGNEPKAGEKHYLQGFPISKNKKFDIHDHENELIKTGYQKVLIKIDQSIKHSFSKVSADTHLFFMYNDGYYQKGVGEFVTVKKQNIPKLQGLSGSGIWVIKNINDSASLQLAGIFTMFREGVGVGTKVNCLNGIINGEPSK